MPWDHFVPGVVDTQATGLVSSEMEDWWNCGWVCMQCGICYPRFGNCFTEGSGICALCVQIAFVAREKRRRQYEYDYLVRRGRRLRVQAKDIFGNDLLDKEPAEEWKPNQVVRDVIIKVADNVAREVWERIVVFQDQRMLPEDEALGFVADPDGEVELFIACVPCYHSRRARAALASAQIYADSRRWEDWRKWQDEADRLEQTEVALPDFLVNGGER